MRNAEGIHRAFAELLFRYHDTLDLLSGQALQDVDRLIAEAVGYAEVIEEVAGEAPTVVDVGSGAGLPGVVVATSLPTAKVVLVERRRRRGAFLELAASRLGLANVTVVKADVMTLRGTCADVVTAQAVAGFADVLRLTRHLHADPCFLVSRRGPQWLEELSAVRDVLDREALGSHSRTLSGETGSTIADRGAVVAGRMSTSSAGSEGSAGTKAPAQSASAFTVPVERRLGHRGSLVALRLTGGPACRSSGS